jgi:TctA family transporter
VWTEIVVAATFLLKMTVFIMGNMNYSILKEQSKVYVLRRPHVEFVVLRVLPMVINSYYVRDVKVWHIAVLIIKSWIGRVEDTNSNAA